MSTFVYHNAETEALARSSLIRKSISQVEILSYNISGICPEDICNFIAHLKLETNFTFAFMQEVSSHTSFGRMDTQIGSCFIFPGLSAAARSNAIIISEEWTPCYVCHDTCQVGGHVALRFAKYAVVLETLHLPYRWHATCFLEHALGQVANMRSRTEQTLIKHGFGHNILWIGGGILIMTFERIVREAMTFHRSFPLATLLDPVMNNLPPTLIGAPSVKA